MLIDSATEPLHGAPAGFRHDAFVYSDDEDFVRHAAPFVRDGLAAGEAVLVALPEVRITRLREELGSDAEPVTFVDISRTGRNPARIIAVWRTLLDQHPGRPVRGLGEPAYPGRTPAELDEAKLHETLLNVAFEHAGQFRLRCPYHVSLVCPELDPAENHPVSTGPTAARRRGESSAASAEKTFRSPLPAVPEQPRRREFGLTDLTEVRRWANLQALSYGLSGDRLADLSLALHEICTNSVRFGGGRGTLSLWTADGGLICDVTDAGRIDDLLIGRVLPPVRGIGGRGVWLANQLCDLVQVRSGADFTQVRLHTRLG